MKKGVWVFKSLLLVLPLMVLACACNKEPRKVDVNDGTENPLNRKLVIEVTDRYTTSQGVLDSLLPKVAVTLYESQDDKLTGRYFRTDTTGIDGKATFQNLKADTFIVELKHKTLGTREYETRSNVNTLVSYEYYYF